MLKLFNANPVYYRINSPPLQFNHWKLERSITAAFINFHQFILTSCKVKQPSFHTVTIQLLKPNYFVI